MALTTRRSLVLPAIAMAAVAIRLSPLVLRTGTSWAIDTNGDSLAYIELARSLRDGSFCREFANRCVPEIDRVPGYPLFLSMMPSIRAAIVTQALLSGLLILWLGYFASRIFGLWAASAAMIFCALDVVWVVNGSEIMSDTFSTVVVGTAVLLALSAFEPSLPWKKARTFALGAAAMCGMAVLIRPANIVLLLLAVAAMFVPRDISLYRRLMLAGCLVLLPLAAIFSWSLRNRNVTGTFEYTSLGATRFYFDSGAGTLAFANGVTMAEAAELLPPIPQAEKSRAALRIILAHPVSFVEATLWSATFIALTPERGPLARLLDVQNTLPLQDPGVLRVRRAIGSALADPMSTFQQIFIHEFDSSWAMVVLTGFQVLWVALLWVGVCMAMLRRVSGYQRLRIVTLLMVAIGFILIAADPQAVPRYRIPASPLLAIIAGVGWFAPEAQYRQDLSVDA